MIPALGANGHLPLGRHRCELAELERTFVADSAYSHSITRREIFEDFRQVVALFEGFGDKLIEVVWVGGSFTSSKLNPADIDCLFVLDQKVFELLSKTRQAKLLKLRKKNHVRDSLGLNVESFILVREEFENPWEKYWVTAKAVHYLAARGAWDDWWQRVRNTGAGSSEPVRGYLEVKL